MKRVLIRVLVVLAGTAALVASSVWLARAYWVDRLAERVAADGTQAKAVLAELAESGAGGIEPLAEAAASTDRAIASAARGEIDRLIRRWRQFEAETPGASRQAFRLRLARSLLSRSSRFSPAGHQWLASVAGRLLRQGPVGAGPALVVACDELLTASRRRSDVLDQIEPRLARGRSAAAPVDPSPIGTPTPQLATPLAPKWSAAPPSAAPPSAAPPSAAPLSAAESPLSSRSPAPDSDEPSQIAIMSPLPAPPPAASHGGDPAVAGGFTPPPDAEPLGWRTPGSEASSVRGPLGFGRERPAAPHAFLALPVHLTTVASLPDRWLLAQALAGDEPIAWAAIVRRGFGEASEAMLAAAISTDEADRLTLVDDLLAARGGAVGRLLLLLGADPSPRVRTRTLSALAASGNPALIDAAWRLAVRDPDPRVAAIAEEIQRR